MFPLGAAYKIITVLICNVTTSCFLLTLGGLGAASRLPSGLKSHPSCSQFPGKRRDFQVRKLDVPGRGKGFSYRGSAPGTRKSGRNGQRAPLSVPGFPGPRPSDLGGTRALRCGRVPALSRGSAQGRPDREAGGQRRRGCPLPREPSQVPAGVGRDRYCFWRAHKSPRRPSRAQVSSRRPFSFL